MTLELSHLHIPPWPEAAGYDFCFAGLKVRAHLPQHAPGQVAQVWLDLLEQLLSQLPWLDAIVQRDALEYKPQLAYIELDDDEESPVHLHYCSAFINTEWGAHFRLEPDGSFALDYYG